MNRKILSTIACQQIKPSDKMDKRLERPHAEAHFRRTGSTNLPAAVAETEPV